MDLIQGVPGGTWERADTARGYIDIGSDLIQISSTDTPSFDDPFFPVAGFSVVGVTDWPWAWQSHVVMAYVSTVPTHWLHTPATGVAESSWTRWLHPRTGHGRGRVRWVFASLAFRWSHVEKT